MNLASFIVLGIIAVLFVCDEKPVTSPDGEPHRNEEKPLEVSALLQGVCYFVRYGLFVSFAYGHYRICIL